MRGDCSKARQTRRGTHLAGEVRKSGPPFSGDRGRSGGGAFRYVAAGGAQGLAKGADLFYARTCSCIMINMHQRTFTMSISQEVITRDNVPV